MLDIDSSQIRFRFFLVFHIPLFSTRQESFIDDTQKNIDNFNEHVEFGAPIEIEEFLRSNPLSIYLSVLLRKFMKLHEIHCDDYFKRKAPEFWKFGKVCKERVL